MFGQKKIRFQKILGPKECWVQKHFGSKNIMGPEKLWI